MAEANVPMQLDLEELGLRGGQKHTGSYSVDLLPVSLGGVEYSLLVPDGVEVVVERIAGGYLVDIGLEAKVFGPCARCLKECASIIAAEQQEFVPVGPEEWDEGSAFIEDLRVDVGGLAREALVLSLPQPVLCSDDCRGLCAECGSNLNRGDCDCESLE